MNRLKRILRLFSFLLVLLAALFASQAKAQVFAGNDTVICQPGNVTLNATVTPTNGTSSYAVSTISYVPFPYSTGTLVNFPSNLDEDISNALPIGFTFCFFGNTYTQFYAGTNGWISFAPGQSVNGNASTPIPSTGFNVPRNCIMACWQDWYPFASGNVRYTTQGTAPFRRLIVSWENLAMYQCTNNTGTFQIICYETTNIIDINILNKPACLTWFNGNGVEGVHDATGLAAATVTGRNATQWTAVNDAQRFTPNGPPNPYVVNWFDMTNTNIGTGNSVNVNVPANSTYYAVVNYSCSNMNDTDSVNVVVGIPANASGTNETCFGYANGSAGVSTTAGGPYTYLWSNGATTDTITNLSAGTYTVTISYGSCQYVDSVTITSPTQILPNSNLADDTCSRGVGMVNTNASGGTVPYSYLWSNGATTSSVNGLAQGNYSVIITDAAGCTTTATGTVADLPPPTAGFTFLPQTPTLLDPIVTFANTATGATQWTWDFGDGSNPSYQANPNHTYTAEGTYIVMLIVQNPYGCVDTIFQTLVVEGFYTFYFPNAFTPNGNGNNDLFFPEYSGIETDGYQMFIFDRWGSIVFETKEPTEGWNGKFKNTGEQVKSDVYVCMFTFMDFKGYYHELYGRVTVLGKLK
jgi:gliding motility-associated-like protein